MSTITFTKTEPPAWPAAQGLPRQGPDDLRRPGHSVSPSDDDPLFLHGRAGPCKGEPLDRLGRPNRVLTLEWWMRGQLCDVHPPLNNYAAAAIALAEPVTAGNSTLSNLTLIVIRSRKVVA
jgi:hypothetical protein